MRSADEIEESFYSQLNRAIIRLEHYENIQQEGLSRNIPDGTAFFVMCNNALFVISARHVVEKSYDLHARVQCRNYTTGKFEVILLTLPKEQWVYHNNNGDENIHFVDVAAMKVPWIKDRSIRYFRYEPQDSNDYKENQLPFEDPEPPDPILVFGFPANVGFELLEQNPLGRLGIISMKTGGNFIKLNSTKFAEERCCLIDARIFGGNSGSPVINQMSLSDPKPKLLGLVIATNANLDFAIMEPVSRIRETLDQIKNRTMTGHWRPLNK